MSILPRDKCRSLFGLIAVAGLAGIGALLALEAADADPGQPGSGLSIMLGRSAGPAMVPTVNPGARASPST